MKFVFFCLLFSVGSSALARDICFGVQELRGIRATLVPVNDQTLSLEYSVHNKTRHCVFTENTRWNGKNQSKSYWFYSLNRDESENCNAEGVEIKKQQTASGYSFVNVNFPCGGGGGCAHGEPGPQESFLCALP